VKALEHRLNIFAAEGSAEASMRALQQATGAAICLAPSIQRKSANSSWGIDLVPSKNRINRGDSSPRVIAVSSLLSALN
jgi:hypothetical protein